MTWIREVCCTRFVVRMKAIWGDEGANLGEEHELAPGAAAEFDVARAPARPARFAVAPFLRVFGEPGGAGAIAGAAARLVGGEDLEGLRTADVPDSDSPFLRGDCVFTAVGGKGGGEGRDECGREEGIGGWWEGEGSNGDGGNVRAASDAMEEDL
jgi:hypothetical protein